MRALILVAIAGCASGPRLQVMRTDAGVPNPKPMEEGTCKPDLRVRVQDAAGNPVPGASVVSHQTQRLNAPSMVPTEINYTSLPVLTNPRGEANVCTPAKLANLAAGFAILSQWTGEYIEARFGDRVGRVAAPYRDAIVLGRAMIP